MGDKDLGAGQRADCLQQRLLGPGVQIGRDLVKQHEPGSAADHPRGEQPAALTRGKQRVVIGHDGRKTSRKGFDFRRKAD